ncbi:MAG: heat-shock protein HtpX, partial [Candidatus Accumulibacter phosphatis]|nr:heat-shock protein HtpX [Candidatus Accumulibacter phosphatis]
MNFFESQERVRKNTTLLVVLFALAVVALIVMANVLVMLVFGFISSTQLRDGQALIRQMDWATFAAVGAGVCAVVLAGSLYKMIALSAGGKIVAESLGGQLLAQNSQDLNQRKLLNVVEEMAIASGTPVPPVYLLADEPGINAFAAGFSPRDAVIGVTQGAIERLNREQLQGVIAHEFSHIFNGDMRLNIRLMGVLNGILVLGIIGYFLLRAAPFSGRRRGNDKGGAGILALALGLMAIGFAGTFFGNLIKAAVSRQREYLADASAVQFTRNPNGIAGALKKIGGLAYGSSVRSPGAAAASHAFFAKGISGFTQWLSATHPPLEKRIRRIDPQWDGLFDVSESPAESAIERESGIENAAQHASARKRVGSVGTMAAGSVAAELMAVMAQVGQPQPQAVDYARALLAELPAPIQDAAREPYGARALVYGLLLDKGEAVRTRQLNQLQAYADPDVFALTRALMLPLDTLDVRFRLPIIDIAMPALKQLSAAQYRSFKGNLLALIAMDARVDLMEWSLQKILF